MNQNDLYQYQQHSITHILENTGCGLFLEMGLGKTVSTLTAIDQLINDRFEVNRVLVVAPLRVAEDVWTTEASKWDHLKHLRISVVLGTEKQRKLALLKKADIYVINRENAVWLVSHYGGAFPFDMLVIDELSSFKSPKAARFKALRMIRPKVNRVVGLTGTPAPNSLLDLWSQVYLLDQGARLGKTITEYRNKYFRVTDDSQYTQWKKYELVKPGDGRSDNYYENKIYDKVGDICISMKAEDYLELPERIDRDVVIRLHGDAYNQYQEFERKQILALSEADEITAINAAALTTKLLQFANGAVYDENKNYHIVHDEKLDRLEEIIDAANGQPVLVFYSYQHDADRIRKKFASLKPVLMKSAKTGETGKIIKSWNDGNILLMVAHPASAGHGLNLQAGGNIIVWFGLPWSLELYQQANARLHRQGQTKPVIVHRLIASGTMDEDVLAALDSKAGGQEALMKAVKARIDKYTLKQAI